jgi:hypothetical protein
MTRRAMVWVGFGAVLGALIALSVIALYQPLQQSIAWRSDMLFGRTSSYQLSLERSLMSLWARGVKPSPNSVKTVVLGDSHLQGLQAIALGPQVVNLSIGGLTAVRFQQYLVGGQFPLPPSAAGYLVHLGHNDLLARLELHEIESAMVISLDWLSRRAPITVMELFPPLKRKSTLIDEKRLIKLNLFLKSHCGSMTNCTWLAVEFLKDAEGYLEATYSGADGVHLSERGYLRLVEELRTN